VVEVTVGREGRGLSKSWYECLSEQRADTIRVSEIQGK
jgi:hypothetical protein